MVPRDDIDAAGNETVNQDMRAAGNFVVASAYFRAVLPCRRLRRSGLDALPNIAGLRLGPIKSPAIGRVIPDFIKVGLSAR